MVTVVEDVGRRKVHDGARDLYWQAAAQIYYVVLQQEVQE
jgi:hypothetical protein